LGNHLGLTITRSDLTAWTWEETTWPDASLGCPQPDQTYAQVQTRGYIITLTYDTVVHEFHTTLDGTTIILCSSGAAPSPELPPPDTNTDPSVQPQTGDPEALLDTGIAYLNTQLNLNIDRSQLVNWTWEATTWPDTSLDCPYPGTEYDAAQPVYGYIITLEHFGTVYELHMTPDGGIIMPCNNTALTPMIGGGLVGAGTAPSEGETVTPTEAPRDLLIYTGPDGNVALGTVDNFPGQAITNDATDTAPTTIPIPTNTGTTVGRRMACGLPSLTGVPHPAYWFQMHWAQHL